MALFDPNTSSFQFQTSAAVIWNAAGTGAILGIDGISLWLIWLVNILMPIVILSCWRAVGVPTNMYYAQETNEDVITTIENNANHQSINLFLILIILIGFWSIAVFIVLDLLLFYISFEGVLIPMYFLISSFGSRNRKIYAAYLFFIYTVFGSLFLLLALLVLYLDYGTVDYQMLLTMPQMSSGIHQNLLWLAFMITFIIKLPLIPFHTWLLEGHTEAPTAASVILAAILLKMGSYGIIRFLIPLFPEATKYFTPLVSTLCIISIIYSCLAAVMSTDFKLVIAYSSIAHQGTATLALFTNDTWGLMAGVYFMISHGLISAGLFLLVGVMYDRYHTRTIKYFRGLVQAFPVYVLLLLIFSLANSSVPLTSGFIAEFLTLVSYWANVNPVISLLAATSIILVPVFMLNVLHRISYGSFSPYLPTIYSDISTKELH